MPIKAGDIVASTPGHLPTMISDGKRLRILWQEGHGNGDSSGHLIERCRSTVKGHPTWKLFCGFVPNPIIRDQNEPPYFVYLDDRACYAIWISQQYNKHELWKMWPFDFDHLGKIKVARPNRGRPAYLDDSCTEYATGTMRDKKKIYVFSGCPDSEFRAARPGMIETDEVDDLPAPNGLPLVTETAETTSTSVLTHPELKLGTNRTLFEPAAPRRYIARPANGDLIPLGMVHKALQGSPYFESPTAIHRAKPRPRAGDLTAAMGAVRKRKAVNVEEKDVGVTEKRRKAGHEAAAVETTMKAKKVKVEAKADD
jgi:hypothetical protein